MLTLILMQEPDTETLSICPPLLSILLEGAFLLLDFPFLLLSNQVDVFDLNVSWPPRVNFLGHILLFLNTPYDLNNLMD